jgi:YqjK-like protein
MTGQEHSAALAARRNELVARAAQQRLDLAAATAPLARRLSWIDDGLAAAHWLRRHPGWLAGTAIALAIWRPSRALRFASIGLALWRITAPLRRPVRY